MSSTATATEAVTTSLETTPTTSSITITTEDIEPISISDNEVNDSVTVTSSEATVTQVAQWVYIQTPPKMTTATSSINNKTTNTNQIVMNAPLQISNITNKTIPTNQGVILTQTVSTGVKSQHLVIQKPTGVQTVPVMPVSVATPLGPRSTLAYLTMVKTQQLAATAGNQQKYVIAPMPKLTSNRLPATVTTNCVQSKIAIMPIQNTQNKHKVFNLKIADGRIQNDSSNGAITVMCDSAGDKCKDETVMSATVEQSDRNESPEDKSYELSIVEESGAKDDVSFMITIPDDVPASLSGSSTTENKNKIQAHTKLPKHGVSILKKSFNLEMAKTSPSEKAGGLTISPVPNSIITVSDSSSKEAKTNSSCSSSDDPVVIADKKISIPSLPPPQKSERRRKSNFSYRKDYDDEVIVTSSGWEDNNKKSVMGNGEATLENNAREVKAIDSKEKSDMNDNFDAKRILKWVNGIGTLPGSEIKFKINEFGLLEYINKSEKKNMDKQGTKSVKSSKEALKVKDEFQEEMRCLECGCYGMPSEFISPKHCSYDCQETAARAVKIRESKFKKKTKAWLKKHEIKAEKDDLPSDDDTTSNENSQDKFNYPWTCTKKGFSWPKYLEHIKAKAAPVKFFKDAFPYNRNGFRPGMKLEGIDPLHASYFCILTVAEVIGYRMRLHFDGYSENYDFWVNADSMDIFPAGWCEKYGHVLHPPPGLTVQEFNWGSYLKQTRATLAPKHLFANRAGSAICPNGFRVGMKLEAVDRKNTSLVCVSTVSDMMGNRILVHFDSWDDIYDYWADPTSPYIHPVGWADQNGHSLTPPNDYPDPVNFTWAKYLKETKSVAAPVRAFKQRPVYAFKKGMRLECVDKRVPQLIRVATVDEAKEHQLRICFDGWPDRYSYWVDNDSHDIHPVGWCQKTGHPIEPPLTPDDVYDFLECPTVGCRGQGHVKGPRNSRHTSPKDCPYSDENLNKEHILSDRLLSPDRQLEAVVPISREPKEKHKSKAGRPPKIPKREPPIKLEWFDDDTDTEDAKPLKRKTPPKLFKAESDTRNVQKRSLLPLTNGYTNSHIEKIWDKHSKHLKTYVKPSTNPRMWRVDDVVQFITSLPYCRNHSSSFKEHKIDGEALLMLNQQDLVDIMKIKLGPAIKLYSTVVLLRRSIS